MPIPFTLRQLEYFIAVAEHGSVTAAAAACHVSQPSISVAISDLEATLARALFRRETGRKLAITPAGRRLLIQARTIVATASKMPAHDMAPDLPREVSLSCFRDLGAIYLPTLLRGFAAEYPNVAFRISEYDLATVRSKLLDGHCELALTYDIGLKAAGIACKEIDRLSPYAMVPLDHPLAGAGRIGFSDFSRQRLILENFPVTLDYFLGMFRSRRIETPDLQLVPSFEMQRGLVANGLGMGLSCVRPKPDISYDGSGFVCVPLDADEPEQVVVIAHLGEATLSVAAQRFLRSIHPSAPQDAVAAT